MTDKLRSWQNGDRPDLPWERCRRDDRGELNQLLSGPVCRHIGVMTLRAIDGAWRGNHIHRVKREEFFVLSGRIEFIWIDTETGERGDERYGAGTRLTIFPGLAHALRALEDAVMIEFSETPYDEFDSIPFDCRGPG